MDLDITIFLCLSISIGLFLLFRKYLQTQPYAIITNQHGNHCKINLKIADTPKKMAEGLMYQKSLPEHTGMIFIFKKPHKIAFWMKNTMIPLDMILISHDLVIVDIKKDLVPMSEEMITSDELSAFVIEVNSGYCERNGIAIGDTVSLHLSRIS